MEAFLRRYMWAINFGLLGAGALLLALLVNGFVATKLAPFTVPEMPQYGAGADSGAAMDLSDRTAWVERLKGRCLFGCEIEVDPDICPDGCPEGQICEAGQCVEVEADEEAYAEDAPQASELNMVLMGAMVAQNPRWSMAMIRDDGEQKTHMVGVGDFLPADTVVEVLEIRRDRVFIDHDGRLEFIRMVDSHDGDPGGQSRSTAASRTTTKEQASRQRKVASSEPAVTVDSAGGYMGGIARSEGNNRYAVNREAVRTQMQDPAALVRQARIMPNYRDGEPNGLRLVGVTPNSVYSQLGIRSGDVIHSVNGAKITSQNQAMQLLEKLQEENSVTIEVERRGRKQKMEYSIK